VTAGIDLELAAPAARELTDRIKTGVEVVWELIKQAYTERAWSALGYASWDEYCTREFGTSRLRLPREERPEVIASLRESGLSLRAIESATGISRKTVIKDLAQVVESTPPAEPDEDALPEELIEQQLASTCLFTVNREKGAHENYMKTPGGVTESTPGQTDRVAEALTKANAAFPTDTPAASPMPITGTDGKQYQPRSSAPQADPAPEPKRPRKPITESFRRFTWQIGKNTESLKRLAGDDRFDRNGNTLARANLWDLKRARENLDDVIVELESRRDQ
jgi:hypothetical protein